MKKTLTMILLSALSASTMATSIYDTSKEEVVSLETGTYTRDTFWGLGPVAEGVTGPQIAIDGVGYKPQDKKKTPQEEGILGKSMSVSHVLSHFKNDNDLVRGNRIWKLTGEKVASKFNGFGSVFIPAKVKEVHAGLAVPQSHLSIGRVGDANIPNYKDKGVDDGVYFGVWHRQAGKALLAEVEFENTTDAVFYGGANATANLDGLKGTAKYNVTGLTHQAGNNATTLVGILSADFGAKTLTGHISGENKVLDIGTATIENDASFTGHNATMKNIATGGEVKGHFFDYQGQKAGALAGIVDFKNPKADTAFGGQRTK